MKKIYTILLSLCFVGMNIVCSDNPTTNQGKTLTYRSPEKERSFKAYCRNRHHKKQQGDKQRDKKQCPKVATKTSFRKNELNVNQTK